MLPKIQTPTFKVTVPSLDREILMRPFLVKEEKILLLAKQSQDQEQIFLSLNQIIQNCIIDEDIDVIKLPYYDIEYLFVNLRLNSVGESVDIEVTDDNGNKVQATVDLNSVQINKSKSKKNIKLNESAALVMKYPTLDELAKVSTKNQVDTFFETLMYCIKSVFYDDESYEFSSYSYDEKMEFLDSLSMDDITKCREFVSDMPSVSVEAFWPDVDGKRNSKIIKGMNSFF